MTDRRPLLCISKSLGKSAQIVAVKFIIKKVDKQSIWIKTVIEIRPWSHFNNQISSKNVRKFFLNRLADILDLKLVKSELKNLIIRKKHRVE